MWFSRRRSSSPDSGGAALPAKVPSSPRWSASKAQHETGAVAEKMAAFGISGGFVGLEAPVS